MHITLDIPDDLVGRLREVVGENLGRAAIERLALDGYQSGKLNRYDIQQLLGFDNRWDTESWLGQHGARSTYSMDDLECDRRTLERLLVRSKTAS